MRVRRRPASAATALVAVLLATLSPPAHAQVVVLRIHPRVGDTLVTRFEQRVEMTAVTHLANSDTTVSLISEMVVLSRMLVQSSDDQGTVVTSITDSVGLASSGDQLFAPPSEEMRQALQGRRVKMRITPEGKASVLESSAGLGSDLQSMVSSMPATLPRQRVQIGDSWIQVMSIPVPGENGAKGGVVTTYHLDSLKHNGEVAFISMRGSMERDSTAAQLEQGIRLVYTGSSRASC